MIVHLGHEAAKRLGRDDAALGVPCLPPKNVSADDVNSYRLGWISYDSVKAEGGNETAKDKEKRGGSMWSNRWTWSAFRWR